jgi:hypothetical protein
MTTSLEPNEKDFGQMFGLIMGFFQTQIAGAIANYSIADHLAKGPATADEIAKWEGISPQATFRLLRACASLGLVTHDGTRFTATPLLATLRREVPGSLHSFAAAFAAPGHWLPWGQFSAALQAGAPQTFPTLGGSIWEYYKQQPEECAAFTHAMHGFTSGLVKDVVQVLDTTNVKLAADIGGASGTLLYGLMAANPHLHGIVVDLPDTVGSAETAARELGLSNREHRCPVEFLRARACRRSLSAKTYSP